MNSFNPIAQTAHWLVDTFALESDIAVSSAVLVGIVTVAGLVIAVAAVIAYLVEKLQ